MSYFVEVPRLVVLGSGGSSASTLGASPLGLGRTFTCRSPRRAAHRRRPPRVFTSLASVRAACRLRRSLSTLLYTKEDCHAEATHLAELSPPAAISLSVINTGRWVKLNVRVLRKRFCRDTRTDCRRRRRFLQINFSSAVGFYETAYKEFYWETKRP